MNLRKFVSIIAIIAIIGFVFFSCEEDDPGKTTYGETLKLSGQVHNYPEISEADQSALTLVMLTGVMTGTWSGAEEPLNKMAFPKTEKFTGSLDIEEQGGTSGKITSGSFSFEMGKPDSVYLTDINDYLDTLAYLYKNPSADNMNVQVYGISEFKVVGSDKYNSLSRANSSGKIKLDKNGNLSLKADTKNITYVYVTENVKITAKGDTNKIDGMDYVTKDISLSLKKGWNVVKQSENIETKGGKMPSITDMMGGGFDPSKIMGTVTMTISQSLGDADTSWILSSGDDVGLDNIGGIFGGSGEEGSYPGLGF